MSDTLKCPSCGGLNQLPDGISKMFCSFCGNKIEKEIKIDPKNISENPLKAKPKIIDNKLSLNNRKIKSLHEIIEWFSDGELDNIYYLDLSENEINTLNGLKNFKFLQELNLSNNKVYSLEDSDKSNIFSGLTKLNLSNNFLKTIPESIINKINSPTELPLIASSTGNFFSNQNVVFIEFDFNGNPISNKEWIDKINFTRIFDIYNALLGKNWKYSVEINDFKIIINRLSEEESDLKETVKGIDWENEKLEREKLIKEYERNNKCFIATATMGSYDHPVVMDLRLFRDNWLIKRNWGVAFTKWYYTHGPKAAKLIEKSNLLKRVTYILIIKPLHLVTKKMR